MDHAAIEQQLRTFFQTRAPEVAAAYLFGSVARVRARNEFFDLQPILAQYRAARASDS